MHNQDVRRSGYQRDRREIAYRIVIRLGQKVADAQRDVDDQKAISDFVQSQRDSISGVSLDEEMSNLVMFQKAFQASAKLISMTDEMLNTIIQM